MVHQRNGVEFGKTTMDVQLTIEIACGQTSRIPKSVTKEIVGNKLIITFINFFFFQTKFFLIY